MRKRVGRVPDSLYLGFLLLSVLFGTLAEETKGPSQMAYYEAKVRATSLMATAEREVWEEKQRLNLVFDGSADPNHTGMIGLEATPLTSEEGILEAKRTSTNPNFAAAMVEMLLEVGVRPGDTIAAGISGSFPALNVALYAACEALRLNCVVISSVAASSWGATEPQLTWLDMEMLLNRKGVFRTRSAAASVGGSDDRGGGLTAEGIALARQAGERNGVPLIEESTLEASIGKRMEIYRQVGGFGSLKAFVNIGGAAANLGSREQRWPIPPGPSPHLLLPAGASHLGCAQQMAARGLAIVNLSEVTRIARRYRLEVDPKPLPPLGKGRLFEAERYSVPFVVAILVVLVGIVVAVSHFELERALGVPKPRKEPPGKGEPELL